MLHKHLSFHRRSWDVPVSVDDLIYTKNLCSERSAWCFDANMALSFDCDSELMVMGKALLPYKGILTWGSTRRSIAIIKSPLQPALLAGHRLSRARY